MLHAEKNTSTSGSECCFEVFGLVKHTAQKHSVGSVDLNSLLRPTRSFHESSRPFFLHPCIQLWARADAAGLDKLQDCFLQKASQPSHLSPVSERKIDAKSGQSTVQIPVSTCSVKQRSDHIKHAQISKYLAPCALRIDCHELSRSSLQIFPQKECFS